MNFCLLWKVLLIFSCFWQPQSAVLHGTCSQCLSNGIACLDERTFSMCYHGTMTNQIIKCATGSICTNQKTICVSELDAKLPICAEDNCDNCAPTQGRFACVNQTSYGFCFGAMTHYVSTVRHCPDGMVCTLQGANVCDLAEITSPTCVPQIDDDDDIEPTDVTTATTEDTGSITDGTEAITANTGATTEVTEATTEDTGTTTEDVGATTEDTEATTEETGATTVGTGATTWDTEATTEGTGTTTEDVGATTEDAEATTEDSGATTEDIRVSTEDIGATTERTGATTEGSSATTEVTTPATEETKATSKETTTDKVASTSGTMTTTEKTSSTEVEPIDLLIFCENKKTMGNFKDESDKSCKQYIYCYLLSGQYLGYVYKCAGYFNGITNRCQDVIPADCTSIQ